MTASCFLGLSTYPSQPDATYLLDTEPCLVLSRKQFGNLQVNHQRPSECLEALYEQATLITRIEPQCTRLLAFWFNAHEDFCMAQVVIEAVLLDNQTFLQVVRIRKCRILDLLIGPLFSSVEALTSSPS